MYEYFFLNTLQYIYNMHIPYDTLQTNIINILGVLVDYMLNNTYVVRVRNMILLVFIYNFIWFFTGKFKGLG